MSFCDQGKSRFGLIVRVAFTLGVNGYGPSLGLIGWSSGGMSLGSCEKFVVEVAYAELK
jgi:hypothetical protein